MHTAQAKSALHLRKWLPAALRHKQQKQIGDLLCERSAIPADFHTYFLRTQDIFLSEFEYINHNLQRRHTGLTKQGILYIMYQCNCLSGYVTQIPNYYSIEASKWQGKTCRKDTSIL